MNAEEEGMYSRNEWSNYQAHCRTFGINPFPANKTTHSEDKQAIHAELNAGNTVMVNSRKYNMHIKN